MKIAFIGGGQLGQYVFYILKNKILAFLRRIFYFNTVIIFSKDLTGDIRNLFSLIPYELKMVGERQINDLLSMDNQYIARELKELFKKGDRIFFGYFHGDVVYRCSVTFGQKKVNLLYNYLPYSIAEGEAFIYYCKTRKDLRRKGIYSSALNKIEEILVRGFNIKKLLIATSKNNIASIRGIKKANYVENNRVRIVNILGLMSIDSVSLGKEKIIKLRNL